MLVDVTQTEIDNGTPGMCGFCPVARALQRTTGFPWFVSERDAVPMTRLLDPTYTHRLLPEAVSAWIRSYDAGERVQPFAFEIDLNEFLLPENA